MEMNKVFKDGLWSKEINVSDFVHTNITPYEGDASFLAGPTERTKKVWNECLKALEEERANNGVRSLDNVTVSTITSHKAGYIDRENELIVGLQTDELLRRAIKPYGGIKVVEKACHENGVEVDEKVKDIILFFKSCIYNLNSRVNKSPCFLTIHVTLCNFQHFRMPMRSTINGVSFIIDSKSFKHLTHFTFFMKIHNFPKLRFT